MEPYASTISREKMLCEARIYTSRGMGVFPKSRWMFPINSQSARSFWTVFHTFIFCSYLDAFIIFHNHRVFLVEKVIGFYNTRGRLTRNPRIKRISSFFSWYIQWSRLYRRWKDVYICFIMRRFFVIFRIRSPVPDTITIGNARME